MSHCIRCPKTSLVEWFDSPGQHRCPFCGEIHETYQAGAPKRQVDSWEHNLEPKPRTENQPTRPQGLPNIIPDTLPKHYDWGAGRSFDSRSRRKKFYEAHGLRLKSAAEHRRQFPGNRAERPGRSITYGGQQDHRSSAERGGVRTKDGTRVI